MVVGALDILSVIVEIVRVVKRRVWHISPQIRKDKLKKEKGKKKEKLVWKTEKEESLKEVTVNIRLERIDIQEGIKEKALLDSRVMGCEEEEVQVKENWEANIYKKCGWNI